MKTLKEQFIDSMMIAVDLAEIIFISTDEKNNYINNAWENYSDEITEWFCGLVGDFNNHEEFEVLFKNYYLEYIKDLEMKIGAKPTLESMYSSSMIEAIFDNDITEIKED